MQTYTIVFKQVTERLLPVRVEAEDFDDAMERGLELIRLHQEQPEALTKHTRSRWGHIPPPRLPGFFPFMSMLHLIVCLLSVFYLE